MIKRIYLVGYRCSGKTTVGRLLAEELNWPFIDLDHQFEIRTGTTIRSFWEERGENAFRTLEKNLLNETLERESRVVATGGGVVEDDENRLTLQENCVTVWLKAKPETLRERMQTDESTRETRPPLSGTSALDEIEETLARRKPLYEECCSFSVDTDSRPPEEIVQEIRKELPLD